MQAWILVHCSRKKRKATRTLYSDHFSSFCCNIYQPLVHRFADTFAVFLPIIILPAEPLDTFKVPVSQSGKPANRKNGLAVCASVMGNSPFTSFCFHDSTVTVVDCYMSGIADDITCFCFGQTGYCLSNFSEPDIQSENSQYHWSENFHPIHMGYQQTDRHKLR